MAPGSQAGLGPLALPGLGEREARVRVDPNAPPWSAEVRVQIPGVSRCTGFAVAPTEIITAGHCLYSRSLGHTVPAEFIHVLSGYQGGEFLRHALVVSYWLPPGFKIGPGSVPGMDVALLRLPQPVSRTVLPLVPALWGEGAMLAGYSQDFAEALTADTHCRVLGLLINADGWSLRRHSCAGTRGTSGAPLLVQGRDGAWAAAGVQVLAGNGVQGGLAVPSETVQRVLRDAGRS